MSRKKIVLKVSLYAIFLLLLYFFQASVFPRVRIFGVKPLFIPLAVVCIGIFEGSLTGALLGLLCGLLCDFSMADTTVLFTVFLTVTGFCMGYFGESVLARGFPSCLVCSVIVLLLCAFLQSFKLLFFMDAYAPALLKTALLQTAYSIFFILPVYWSVRTISRRTRA